MSERLRCVETQYMGALDERNGTISKSLRVVCDRPMGHRGDHKGRLFVGSIKYGVLSWLPAWPKP